MNITIPTHDRHFTLLSFVQEMAHIFVFEESVHLRQSTNEPSLLFWSVEEFVRKIQTLPGECWALDQEMGCLLIFVPQMTRWVLCLTSNVLGVP